jgi:urea transport system ATP-binding protein
MTAAEARFDPSLSFQDPKGTRNLPTQPGPVERLDQDYLQVKKLHVEFDGFVAVDDVDLLVTRGDLRFLIGPNGAGKTTIIDAITGLTKAGGSALFGGVELLGMATEKIVRQGVGRTFQTASVIEDLTVLQNLDIAAGMRRRRLTLLRQRKSTPPEVAEALETIGLTDVADRPAGILAHGQKQWLEIGMLLVQDARLLLLDEPVAGMSAEEREETGRLLQRIAQERTVVVVEHDMEFLRSFADSVTVLHQGKVIAEGSVAEVQANPKVVEVYLGPSESFEPVAERPPKPRPKVTGPSKPLPPVSSSGTPRQKITPPSRTAASPVQAAASPVRAAAPSPVIPGPGGESRVEPGISERSSAPPATEELTEEATDAQA